MRQLRPHAIQTLLYPFKDLVKGSVGGLGYFVDFVAKQIKIGQYMGATTQFFSAHFKSTTTPLTPFHARLGGIELVKACETAAQGPYATNAICLISFAKASLLY